MRDYSDIIPIYEQRWADKPDSYYFLPLANAYRAVGQPDRAIEVLSKGLERHPDYHSGRAALAVAYLDAELHEEAIEEAKSVLAAQPENLLTRRLLVECYREAGQVEEALAEMKHLLELAPADDRLQGALQAMEGYLAEEAEEAVAEAEAPAEESALAEVEEVVPIEDFAEVLEEMEEEPAEAAQEDEEPRAEDLVEEEPQPEEPPKAEVEVEEGEPVEVAAEEEPPEEEPQEAVLEEEREEPHLEAVDEEAPPEEELPAEELPAEELLEEPTAPAERSEEDERPEEAERPEAPEAMDKFLSEDEEEPQAEPPPAPEEEEAQAKDFSEFLAAVDLPDSVPDGEEEPKDETLAEAEIPVEKVPEVVFEDDETILEGDVGVLEEDEPPDEEVQYAETEEVVFADDAPQEPGPGIEPEPKATATLGELYAAQGHLEDAASVFRQLLEEDPQNERYLRRLEEIERELAGPAPSEPEAAEASPPAEAQEPSEGELEALVDDADAVEEIHDLFPAEPDPEEKQEEEDTSGEVITSLKGWLENLKRRSGPEPPAVDTP